MPILFNQPILILFPVVLKKIHFPGVACLSKPLVACLSKPPRVNTRRIPRALLRVVRVGPATGWSGWARRVHTR
jgi:hypothetical protein